MPEITDFSSMQPVALDVLVIAPHPDDAELGMGGAILKLVAAGKRVGILDLTDGEPTPHGSPELRKQETDAASKTLALTWRWNLGLPNRCLEPTLESRRLLANAIRLTRPRWLFAPFWIDAHPDHIAATQLVEAARFWAKLTKSELLGEPHYPERIYHYYSVHLRHRAEPALILDISAEFERKLESIACYESQFITGRKTEPPTFLDQLRIEAGYWGKLIGRTYGEPFTSREPIGLSGLDNLI